MSIFQLSIKNTIRSANEKKKKKREIKEKKIPRSGGVKNKKKERERIAFALLTSANSFSSKIAYFILFSDSLVNNDR